MRLGIIGLPQAGKTTIFNALTRGNQPVTTSGGRFEVHTGVVDVPDERIDRLSLAERVEDVSLYELRCSVLIRVKARRENRKSNASQEEGDNQQRQQLRP